MTRDVKLRQLRKQRSKDFASKIGPHRQPSRGPSTGFKPNTSKQFSDPAESVLGTYRGSLASRAKRIKVTLPPTPWDNEED